jgi:hypothetical protein
MIFSQLYPCGRCPIGQCGSPYAYEPVEGTAPQRDFGTLYGREELRLGSEGLGDKHPDLVAGTLVL